MKQIQKALTFRASSIGDCLMGKYVLENIHVAYPAARCAIVVSSRGALIRDLFEAYPWLEIIEVNRRSPRAMFSLLKNFYGCDLVVTQYAGKRGGSFGLASKIVARVLAKRPGLIGFSDASRLTELLYDHVVPAHSDKAVAEHDQAALRAAGIAISLPFPTLEFVRDTTTLDTFKLEEGRYIIVHLFAGNKGRGLHPDKKRELLTALVKKFPDTHFVISGGVADQEEAYSIAERLSATVIAGKVTLQELMNIIFKSRGVVSIDTGVAHIAAQLRKPLVVMHSCVGANWWLPKQYGEDARITTLSRADLCATGHWYKEYPDCINSIDMQEAAKACKGFVPLV